MSDQAELHDASTLSRMAEAVGRLPKAVREILSSADQDAIPRLRRIDQLVRAAQERERWAERAVAEADDEERDQAEAELEDAREALARMEAAAHRVQEALDDYRRSARALNDIECRSARQFLDDRVAAVQAYRAIQLNAASQASPAQAPAAHPSNPTTSGGLPATLPPLPAGYAWIPIGQIEQPIGSLEWKKVDRSTVVTGMTAFARDLVPLLSSSGLVENDLVAFDRDHERVGPGAVHPESLTNLHAIMFGSDPIGAEKGSDGVFHVASGRHRIEVARSLGWTHVPAFVIGGR